MMPLTRENLKYLHPRDIRALIREGRWTNHTAGIAEGYVQANLVAVPRHLALDFLVFCQRNPQPCPVLEVTDVGVPELAYMAKGADLRTDLPMYRVWKEGECVGDVDNVVDYWNDELVGFLLGCSYSMDWALVRAGVRLRHMEEGRRAKAYISDIQCRPAGLFHGPMVVTMRPIRKDQVARAFSITSRYPGTHGAPVHIGDPRQIGIGSLDEVAFGDKSQLTQLAPDEVPVFWACGVTPQVVALESRPEFMISHAPGCMFLTDVSLEQIAAI